ncbi:cellobiose phosphorylase [Paenibacillus sp. SC116]|uniref:GH36-type glycosyl hydrolase domain-containing protein n=1 Tax=Paenibacillus sp. SC116 TaxID=2968986 RepID=UPI00215A6216|nr:cellobiose phosphorylase [Paenibacillus sp. SC116]MCR8845384.1 cellobiose phosphorylase [Paenibacillus sp. SC116]
MTTLTNNKIRLEAGSLAFTFLTSGDLYQATYQDVMINQWLANSIDGSMNNLYLRVYEADGIQAYPLLGVRSSSRVWTEGNTMMWEGELPREGALVSYRVVLTLTEQGMWFWDVSVEGHDVDLDIDVIYGQDIGIADPRAVRSNEAYLSHYIDHAVFEDDNRGYVICSRQNLPQGGQFPYIQQGSLTKAIGYSTDGFQFFGLSYKETNEPERLTQTTLANEIYQYEFAYAALQSERVRLKGEAKFVFYGVFQENHPEAISTLEYSDKVQKAWDGIENARELGEGGTWLDAVRLSPSFGAPLQTVPFTEEELEKLFPQRYQEERADGQLLSFFTEQYEHVVLKEKELRVERPHGHILMSGDNAHMKDNVITTTSYMYGIFNSQLVVGNTSFNKMMTNARNALNIPKTSGQRIYVELDGIYRLLAMPSLFEMGFNYTRWYYKTEDDLLMITNFTTVDSPEVRLNVRSMNGSSYRFVVTSQISMNVDEYEMPYHMSQNGSTLLFHADASSLSAGVHPNLAYQMHIDGAHVSILDERMLAPRISKGNASLSVLELSASSDWTMSVQGLIDGEQLPLRQLDMASEIERYREFFDGVMNGFRLSHKDEQEGDLFKVNALAWWYTHNMLVHYSMPHGLEQYGGAAWGTRDVCQGPVEYFMATHKYEQVREILLTVFAHQYEDDGNWPQWFMFDKYTKIQQEDSHGDIIVWPLKVLGDYLAVTRDFSILEELVPYTRKHSFDFTEERATVLAHAQKEISYIRNHFLHDTYLSSYGDGDWDDTLQPANAQLKQYLISSWTVALTYQTIRQFSKVIREYDQGLGTELHEMAEGIERDFNRYMMQTDVIPGFVYMEQPDQAKLMLHPTDKETGIQYRLLPMTRSMISELLPPEQAEAHYRIIREQFYCPDGVRLMNRPAQYAGGVSTHFKRAEQAANFGREIGLQYVHAHIRYVEAMAKLGKADEVWSGLATINPIGLRDVVKNAELRQSNAYFSSSDGKFNTRYEAQECFDKLRTGEVAVKGGWRIYSSGPGIYMNQLISNALGIRQENGDLLIDPVLPQMLDGMRFEFEYAGVPVTFIYHIAGTSVSKVVVNGVEAVATVVDNRYRSGGIRVSQHEFNTLRKHGEDRAIIEIYM